MFEEVPQPKRLSECIRNEKEKEKTGNGVMPGYFRYCACVTQEDVLNIVLLHMRVNDESHGESNEAYEQAEQFFEKYFSIHNFTFD